MNKIKKLIEKRNALIEEMEALADKAGAEERAFTDEESADFEAKRAEAERLGETIKAAGELRDMDEMRVVKSAEEEETAEVVERRMFEDYLRGRPVEMRADTNMIKGDNTAVIPSTIANKIIERVVEICPIYSMGTRYNVKGTLNIPYYDESTQRITMAYAEEFTELESTSGKFASISLTGHLAGVLTKISKSLINNSQFDIVSYVVQAMAKNISIWIENELLHGTSGKIEGLSGVSRAVTAASATVLTVDNLIDLQEAIPDRYQSGAVFIMAKGTRTSIRKLKDSEGNLLLNRDMTSRWGYTLLGKPVYISDAMDGIGAGKTSIFYGDLSGLAVKVVEEINIEILREKYATQHVLGVVGWLEMDAKIEDAQKLAKLVHAS